MSSSETPHTKIDKDVVSSSFMKEIQRRVTDQDAMIDSIRSELFTPPPASDRKEIKSPEFHDDGELCDEIRRLDSLQEDIRQDIDDVNEALSFPTKRDEMKLISREERNGLVLFVMIALWLVVYAKEWFAYSSHRV